MSDRLLFTERSLSKRSATPTEREKVRRQSQVRAPRLSPVERRSQLLQQAIAVCAQKGIGRARPIEVASAAGVSESTVYAYFQTRSEMIQAVLGEVEHFYMENNERFLAGSDIPVPELILGLGAAFSESVESHPDHARVWLDWSNSIGEMIFSRYLEYQERVVQLVTATLQRGRVDGTVANDIVAEDAARILYMSAQMVVQLKLTGRPSNDVNRFLISTTRAVIGRPVRSEDLPQQLIDRLEDVHLS